MEEYIVVTYPESLSLQDIEGFDDNAYLINDEKGLEDFGSCSYFVEKNWYIKNK